MSAALLREAAEALRERATVRGVPAGPWFVQDDGGDWNILAPDPAMPGLPWDVARDVPGDQGHLATYIATMHPGVGLALADWLDAQAGNLEALGFDGEGQPTSPSGRAHTVARLILGRAS